MKCQKCKRKATIETIDGHYCNDDLPEGFCRGCGELVLGIYWHEEHIALMGVCGNCAESIRNNINSKSSISFFAI